MTVHYGSLSITRTSGDQGTSTAAGSLPWQAQGHCAADPGPFAYDGPAEAAKALRICRGLQDERPECPVRGQCAEAGRGEYGVWGGQWLDGGGHR